MMFNVIYFYFFFSNFKLGKAQPVAKLNN